MPARRVVRSTGTAPVSKKKTKSKLTVPESAVSRTPSEDDLEHSLTTKRTISSGGGFLGVPEEGLLARKASINKAKARQLSRKLSFNADDNVKACVRVRPFRDIEREPAVPSCVKVKGRTVTMPHNGVQHSFEFDHVFWSVDESDPDFAEQSTVHEALGSRILEHVFKGYNACIMAYGQTGSGKTYTMMGPDSVFNERGLTPRVCEELFARLNTEERNLEDASIQRSYQIEVRYMEVYMEKVRDLLDAGNQRKMLKVRLHPITGPFVEGLSCHEVSSWPQCFDLISQGMKARAVASTRMNDVSSRSHAIFRITLTQTTRIGGLQSTRMANLNLVDLAGSERVSRSGVQGDHLAEAAKVNLSLSTLRKVIDALLLKPGGSKRPLVPYRESVLTWVLSDSLGGNSRTMLLATVSPHFSNSEETLSTLVYANKARKIVNNVNVNEDNSLEIMQELQQTLATMKQERVQSQLRNSSVRVQELEEAIELNEKALQDMENQSSKLEAKYAGEVRELRTVVAEKERRSIQLTEENRQLEEEKQEALCRRESLRIRYNKANDRLLSKEGKLLDAERNKHVLESENEHLQKDLDKETKSRDLAEKKVDVMRNEVSTIKKKMDNFDMKWAHVSTDTESWKRRAKQAEEEADEVSLELAKTQRENKKLNEAVEIMKKDIAILKAANSDEVLLSTEKDALKDKELKELKQRNTELELHLGTETAKNAKLSATAEVMETSSIASDKRAANLSVELKKTREGALADALQKDLEWKLKLEGERDALVIKTKELGVEYEKNLKESSKRYEIALEKEQDNIIKMKAEFAEELQHLESKYSDLHKTLPVLRRLHDHIFEVVNQANEDSKRNPSAYTAEHLRLVNIVLRFDSSLKSAPLPHTLATATPASLTSPKTRPPPVVQSPTKAVPVTPPKLAFCKFGGSQA